MSDITNDKYKEAGVDIDAGEALISQIAPLADATSIPGATEGPGGFGGIFDLQAAGFKGNARLVAGTDGVGTKLKIAFATGIHNTIGIDCVAMCVNDIITIGARPLFFLDYFATGSLEPDEAADVVRGIAEGCKQARCWLMGGETAEMPGMYDAGEYDLAGFAVGAVNDALEQRPDACEAGDAVIALPSSGIHSNGFSLVRSVLNESNGFPWDEAPPRKYAAYFDDPKPHIDNTLGRLLLEPTRIYVSAVKALQDADISIHASSHITGGGLWENPQRATAPSLKVVFDTNAVKDMRLPIFDLISHIGEVSEREMYRVFNMGIGFLFTVSGDDVDDTLATLRDAGESPAVVGHLEELNAANMNGDDASPSPSRVKLPGLSEQPISV